MANQSPLMLAASFGLALSIEDWAWARRLLLQGADLRACKANAATCNHARFVCSMLEEAGAVFGSSDFMVPENMFSGQTTPTMKLASNDFIQFLLDKGIAAPRGVLAAACLECRVDVINCLLKSGADIADALPERRCGCPGCLEACLISAKPSKAEREDSLMVLLRSGAEPITRPARKNRDTGEWHFELGASKSKLGFARNLFLLGLSGTARFLASELWDHSEATAQTVKARTHLISVFHMDELAERETVRAAASSSQKSSGGESVQRL